MCNVVLAVFQVVVISRRRVAHVVFLGTGLVVVGVSVKVIFWGGRVLDSMWKINMAGHLWGRAVVNRDGMRSALQISPSNMIS